jgi:hypothetical protein
MNVGERHFGAMFSPHGYFTQVSPGQVQPELRCCFKHWGSLAFL